MVHILNPLCLRGDTVLQKSSFRSNDFPREYSSAKPASTRGEQNRKGWVAAQTDGLRERVGTTVLTWCSNTVSI